MDSQPIPTVSRDDVMRIVRRDFPEAEESMVLGLLDGYGAKEWHRERDRVQLAILKVADDRLGALELEVEQASNHDFRDVLAAAEYPAAMRKMGLLEMEAEKRSRIYVADWEQYQAWLRRA